LARPSEARLSTMPFPPPTEKQARVIWCAVTGLACALILALLVALVWGLGQVLGLLSAVLWPLAVAGVLAYLLDPIVDWLERRRVPRTRAILCVFALVLVMIAGLFSSVVPQLVVETRQLVLRIPTYTARVQARIDDWVSHPPDLIKRVLRTPPEGASAPTAQPPDTAALQDATATHAPPHPGDTNALSAIAVPHGPTTPSFWVQALDAGFIRSITAWLAKAAPVVGAWLFGQVTRVASWFGMIAGLILIPVFLFYFLLEKRAIQSHWTEYLPVARSGFKDELVFVLSAINDYLIAFFRGQVLVAICDGILYTLGFIIIGLPYAVLLGVMATFLTMIPYLGAITTCIAALILAFAQFGDWLHPLLVLAVFAVVQSLEGLVISPKIMGDRVGLHPLTIIIAVLVGTTLLGGLLGGILAIPLTAALRVLMFRYVWRPPAAVQGDPASAAKGP